MVPPPAPARGSCKHILHVGAMLCASVKPGRLPGLSEEGVGLRGAEAVRSQSSDAQQ